MDPIDDAIMTALEDGPAGAFEIEERMARILEEDVNRQRVTRHLTALVRYGMIHIVAYRSCKRPVYGLDGPDAPVEAPEPLRDVVLRTLEAGPMTVSMMRRASGRDISRRELCTLEHMGRVVRDGTAETFPGGNPATVWRLA